MNRLHRFLVGVAALFLVAEGLALLLEIELGSGEFHRRLVFSFGTMCALVGLLLWWTSSRVRPAKDRVWFKGHGGRVSLGVDVIQRHLAEVADEFPSIRRLDSTVTPAGRAIDIDLGVHFEKGTPLPDVTQALQERARESLSETMGPFAVRKIHVHITDVGDAGEVKAPAQEPAGTAAPPTP